MTADASKQPLQSKMLEALPSAEHVIGGIPIPKPQRVTIFSPEEWESFTLEWTTSLESAYVHIDRLGGSGDFGIDIVGFISDTTFAGGWDNYQCKRYDHPLRPSDIWVEIGKIIYYSYRQEYSPPRKYYFVASQGIGTYLQKLLGKPNKLKEEARNHWAKHCENGITTTASLPLEGELLNWFENFDFSIFSAKSVVELIDGHAKTPFHTVRFGGGLPPRPCVTPPPEDYDIEESRYIQQLFTACEDHLGIPVNGLSDLSSTPRLRDELLRQRERFYHAESLRNFARDTVPEGTFERLQDEIYHGVIDICEGDHKDGLMRMRATVSQAAMLPTPSSPLQSVVQVQDKQGICHQLANGDQLVWVPNYGEVHDGSTV